MNAKGCDDDTVVWAHDPFDEFGKALEKALLGSNAAFTAIMAFVSILIQFKN
jgi:hypothetical protein